MWLEPRNRAKQFTSKAAFGKVVTVKPVTTDRYHRTVAEIILPDGSSLNHALVRAGFAWWYRHYAPKDRRLRNLEAAARAAKRGLWADANPTPPWKWRRSKREHH